MVHGSKKVAAQTHVTPRWVKVLVLSALALVTIAGIVMVTGIGGTHGPWRHMNPSQTQGTAGQ